MKGGILESYPALDPARVHVIRNGIDTEIYQATDERERADGQGRRPERADRLLRRPDHPAEGRRPSGRRHPPLRSGRAAGAVRRRAGHPGDRRGDGRGHRRTAGAAARRVLVRRDADPARGQAGAVRVRRVRLPVGVRAAGHRQPGGDGLRGRGGGQRRRRHPRGGQRRRDRHCWCTTTAPTAPGSSGRSPARSTTWSAIRRKAEGVRCGRTGTRAVAEFSWTAIAEQTVELYRSVLG